MDFLIRIFDEGGKELIDLRKTIEANSFEEAEKIALEYERECYKENSFVDWFEVDPIL